MNTELEKAESMIDEIEIQPETRLNSILQSLKTMATFSEVLRFSGALIIVASMSIFLVQGFEATNDMQRYLILLLQTVLLTAGGFAMSFLLKEQKGARVFFGLGLVSIPANFTVLGALVYSVFNLDTQAASYPGFSHWVAPDAGSLLLTLAGAAVVLVPVALLGFSILARKSSRLLTIGFIISNLVLLVPLRGSIVISVIATGVIFFGLWFSRRHLAEDPTLKTPGGWLASNLIFVPAGIMICRSLYLYDVSALVVAMVAFSGFVILRHASSQLEEKSGLQFFFDLVSVPLAIVTSFSVTAFLEFSRDPASLLTFLTVSAVLMLDLVRRTNSQRLATALSVGTVTLVAAGAVLVSIFDHNIIHTVCSLALAAAITGYGLMTRKGFELFTGIIATLAIVIFQFGTLLTWVDFGNWLVLAVIGAIAVITASILERHGVALKLRGQKWAASFSKQVKEAT